MGGSEGLRMHGGPQGKELNAFGKDEEVVLQRFQELRRRQVDLSRRQVELLSRKQRGRFDDTVAG